MAKKRREGFHIFFASSSSDLSLAFLGTLHEDDKERVWESVELMLERERSGRESPESSGRKMWYAKRERERVPGFLDFNIFNYRRKSQLFVESFKSWERLQVLCSCYRLYIQCAVPCPVCYMENGTVFIKQTSIKKTFFFSGYKATRWQQGIFTRCTK